MIAVEKAEFTPSDLIALEEVEQFFGIPVVALLGQGLHRLFSCAQVKRIENFLLQDNLERCNPFEIKARVKISYPHLPSSEETDPQSPSEFGALRETG